MLYIVSPYICIAAVSRYTPLNTERVRRHFQVSTLTKSKRVPRKEKEREINKLNNFK